MAHIMATALTAMRDSRARGMYDRLRRAYNSTRLPDSSPIPPFEEWQGVSSCCDSFYCRFVKPPRVEGSQSDTTLGDAFRFPRHFAARGRQKRTATSVCSH
ncbi:unnamed protein product [Ectocarpus sp. 12 AP-2014]